MLRDIARRKKDDGGDEVGVERQGFIIMHVCVTAYMPVE
jgi:hypothetical protein